MTRTQRILKALPATSVELAALEGTTVRQINADLQHLKRHGRCHRTDQKIKPTHPQRGPWPALWERT